MDHSFFETTPINTYWEFLRLINWFEPWLIGLVGLHIVCFLIILLTRGRTNVQLLIFLVLLAGIFFAEHLNKLAAEKWQLFAHEQYFDSQGLFISTVFCFPIIVNCCVMVIFWLIESVSLLKICIKRKRTQQKNQTKEKKTD